ncbi:peptide synthetase [Reticulibacter mediterranei]|uniref:Peptide synthetase n=1 Tax=Reticulibacter mediterranei TaxID=2778369 RepID=A0A8J3J009_9CHLR|nr:Pls/PosA family non-ribosomal peptide synthetase [Reticulibacter mediterranei]GHP01105.1 peptide synthetase [Reticulibacter mediterranei]
MPTLKHSQQVQQRLAGKHVALEAFPVQLPPTTFRDFKLLHHSFEQTCDTNPTATAVICESSHVTYLELDQRANRLAHWLIAHGCGENRPVGILLERSLDTYVALLGVLKAGAAFVPLDPSFPADRVTFIAEDAELQFLLTTSTLSKRMNVAPCPLLELDQAVEELAGQAEMRPLIDIAPTSLCYVIYTSGTTGRPKGVAISHANITNFLSVVTPIYAIRPDDRVYQGMTIAFDFSLEEIWPTWIVGATLIAGPTDSRRLGSELTSFLIENNITALYCVPTLLATIDRDVPSLRSLFVGGEACPADLVRRWSSSQRRMLNTYGPTETTVTATWCELIPDHPVTIGTPLPTYCVYILDEHLRPLNDGDSGEICIGGPGVAIGYLHRPDLTTDRFVSNPIRSDHTIAPRLYRTGDLGRFTPSGEIEYLGRIDTQVKIRGYRIELGEIEEVLREDHAVENAVINPLKIQGSVQDLVAYITLREQLSEEEISALREQLHASLQLRLPSYMLPSFIEILDSFPLLAAGKVDRSRLPAPVSARLGTCSTPYIPPATQLESKLATVWGQFLGREHISVDDDFFSNLGGHSLAAALVISRLRQEDRLQGLSIGDLYAHPTIRQLAEFISANAPSDTDKAPVQTARPAPQQHSNQRVWGCGILQLLSLYAGLLLLNLPSLSLHWAMDHPWMLARLAFIQGIWLAIISFFLPAVAGRILMGGVQAGTYPLWGLTYVRVWLYRRILLFSPLALLAGSPLLPLYLRLLGARIDHHCHMASAKISLPMLIEIGEDTSIGYGVQLHPFSVEGGRLRLAPIRIGRAAFLGTNCVVQAGAQIGDQAILAEQSLVPQNHVIPAHEYWGGSPCQRLKDIPSLFTDLADKTDQRRWPFLVLAGFVAGTLLLLLLPWLMIAPGVCLVDIVINRVGLLWGMASTLITGPLFVLVVCLLVFVGKRLSMPTAHAGLYPVRSWFGLRKWFSDQLMTMSLGLTNTLYATLYLIPFLRLLGARVGKWSEISTVTYVDPNLLRLGQESFVADMAVIGAAAFYRGWIVLAPTEVGNRSFVGNGALIPFSSRLGDNSLIGVYSVPPTREVDPRTSWLGSPAIFLPRRQESLHFEETVTYRPHKSLIAWRLLIEFFRITFPATLLMFIVLSEMTTLLHLATMLPSWELLSIMPLLYAGIGATATLVIALLKWILIGRYRPRMEPLWSLFVRRSELITGLYEGVAVPCLISFFTGTPWIAPLLRLFGAKIGRRVWLDTTYLTEFDLVEVGDDAAIGEITSLQTHLFEDRVMKMSFVKIGASSSIGPRSVVLYDAEVGIGASLDALSLVMKGESLPPESHWQGIPARAL